MKKKSEKKKRNALWITVVIHSAFGCIWVWGSSDFLTPFSFMYNKPLENEMRHGPKILILFFIYIFLIFQNYHSIINRKKFYNICFLALNFILFINTEKKNHKSNKKY
jgi:hypothetical protein